MDIVSPASAVVRREVRSTLVRWRTLLLVICWFIALVFVTCSAWPESDPRPMELQAISRQMVGMLSAILVVAISVTVPALAAISITSERDDDTFDLLRLTLLSNRGFVLAKVASSLLIIILFFVAVFPVFSVVQFLIGLDNEQIIQLLALLMLHALMCACLGVLCSTLFRRTIVAVAVSYLALFFTVLYPLFAVRLRVFSGMPLGMNPSRSISSSIAGALFTTVMGRLEWGDFALACVLPAVVCVVCVFVATLLLIRNRPPRTTNDAKPIDDQTALQTRRRHFPYYLIDPLRRKSPIPDGRNPMVVREVRWGLFKRSTWMVRAFYITFIVTVFPVLGACVATTGLEMDFLICVQTVLVMCAAPILTGNAWSREREMGNIDMIRMTLLRPYDLFVGKAAGGLTALAPVLVAVIIASIPAYIFHYGSFLQFLIGHLTLIQCTLVACALCLFASFMSRKTTTAIVTGGILCIGCNFFVYAAIALLSDLPTDKAEVFSPVMAYWAWARTIEHTYGWEKREALGMVWLVSMVASALLAACASAASIARLKLHDMRD